MQWGSWVLENGGMVSLVFFSVGGGVHLRPEKCMSWVAKAILHPWIVPRMAVYHTVVLAEWLQCWGNFLFWRGEILSNQEFYFCEKCILHAVKKTNTMMFTCFPVCCITKQLSDRCYHLPFFSLWTVSHFLCPKAVLTACLVWGGRNV